MQKYEWWLSYVANFDYWTCIQYMCLTSNVQVRCGYTIYWLSDLMYVWLLWNFWVVKMIYPHWGYGGVSLSEHSSDLIILNVNLCQTEKSHIYYTLFSDNF